MWESWSTAHRGDKAEKERGGSTNLQPSTRDHDDKLPERASPLLVVATLIKLGSNTSSQQAKAEKSTLGRGGEGWSLWC